MDPSTAQTPDAERARRRAWYLDKAGVKEPTKIPVLTKPIKRDFQSEHTSYSSEALRLLSDQRANDPLLSTLGKPEKQKRHFFRTKKSNEAASRQSGPVFTNFEVASAFDSLLTSRQWPPTGFAQALLAYATTTSMDRLWRCLQEGHIGTQPSSGGRMTWLELAVSRENWEYVQLMCQSQVEQPSLDWAFGVALAQSSIPGMNLLLSHGAGASNRHDLIEQHFTQRHVGIIEILLSAPQCMDTQTWLRCLGHGYLVASSQFSAQISNDILLLCIANHKDLLSESLTLEKVRLQNHQAAAILLAYAEPAVLSHIQREAFELVCQMPNSDQKAMFLELLARSDLLEDEPGTRRALFESVQSRRLQLAKTLVDVGVTVDFPPYNALEDAISRRDFTAVELLKGAAMSLPLSDALAYIPEEATEDDRIRLLDTLGPFQTPSGPLSGLLVRSVVRKQLRLVRKLLHLGASVGFEDAAAVQVALKNADLDALALLLKYECSEEALSEAVPVAMALDPASKRLTAMELLLAKGVRPQALMEPLENLVANVEALDVPLIRLLLGKGAPIDRSDDSNRNPILVTVRKGDAAFLRTLIYKARPRPSSLFMATAVHCALSSIDILDYETILQMITILLRRGASGFPVNQALASAALRDTRLDIARILLQYSADANTAGGVAFSSAIEGGRYYMLELLCTMSPPNVGSFRHALQMIINPQSYSLDMLELVLRATCPTVKHQALGGALGIENHLRDHPHALEITHSLVRDGLDINMGDGLPIIIAVRSKDLNFMRELLAANPIQTSLAAAFVQVATNKPSVVKTEMWEMLLQKASSAEIGQSGCLLAETKTAINGDLAGLRCLVRHKANADSEDGKAVCESSVTGSLEVLKLLLPNVTERSTLDVAFLATSSSSLSLSQKRSIFYELVGHQAGVSTNIISGALYQSITAESDDMLLTLLLLELGPSVDFSHLEAAQKLSKDELFGILIDKIADPTESFSAYRQASMDMDKRYRAYSCLVKKGVSKEELSRALFQFIESHPGDLDIPRLLLENGASVTFKNGFAMADVVESGDHEAVKLLSPYLASAAEGLADPAFDRVARSRNKDLITRLDMYRYLLKTNVAKSRLYHALQETLADENPSNSIVRLLLEHGADPNQHGARSFILAMGSNHELQFCALSRYADLDVVLPKVLSCSATDEDAARWFLLCLQEQRTDLKLTQNDLLISCMKKFREGWNLLEVLLDRGLRASAMTKVQLQSEWEAEPCTTLIWALSSSGRVANEAAIALIERGDTGKSNEAGKAPYLDHAEMKVALATYSTPRTRVSAAFLCLLDKRRAPVLQALIDVGGQAVRNSTIPGSTLRDLASKRESTPAEDFMPLFEDDDEIGLREAALFLGHLPVFRMLHSGAPEDDGTLHMAALLALPDFVQWLLKSHDPNYESEAFDMMVPLALACFSKPFPWCRIAMDETPWKTRLQKTMQLLLPETEKDWQHRKRSPLFIALENGVEVTGAFLRASKASGSNSRTIEIYTDKQGDEYLPGDYISEFVDASDQEKKALRKCLKKHGQL